MIRRPLTLLFVRPAAGRQLDSALRFPIARQAGGVLPVRLLRLATAVKLRTPHRVVVHDARMVRPDGDRSLRSAAALHRPDVVIVDLHPATLADGLDAARAARQSPSTLVLGTGPLVDLWPDGARQVPELDALLPTTGRSALVDALTLQPLRLGSPEFTAALAGPPRTFDREDPVDRKLLDYARYARAPGLAWPPARLARHGAGQVDKGRAAASIVPLSDDLGRPLPPEQVLADVQHCDLLGIPWLDLRGAGAAPADSWWQVLLGLLSKHPWPKRRLRIGVTPATLRRLSVPDLPAAAVDAIDLGEVVAADDDDVAEVVEAGRVLTQAGLSVAVTALVGRPGCSEEHDRSGLTKLGRAPLDLDIGYSVTPREAKPGPWRDWLEAPSADFVPPDVDRARLALVSELRKATQRGTTTSRWLRRTRGLLRR